MITLKQVDNLYLLDDNIDINDACYHTFLSDAMPFIHFNEVLDILESLYGLGLSSSLCLLSADA